MSALRREQDLAVAIRPLAVCPLRASGIGDGGNIFQGTRTPLTVWFRAMWWMTSQKNGISALGLQRVLGWGSYQTAWVCLHKLRRAMIRLGRVNTNS